MHRLLPTRRRLGLERAVAVAQEHGDVAEGWVVVSEVEPAVTGEITSRQTQPIPTGVILRRLERAVAVA